MTYRLMSRHLPQTVQCRRINSANTRSSRKLDVGGGGSSESNAARVQVLHTLCPRASGIPSRYARMSFISGDVVPGAFCDSIKASLRHGCPAQRYATAQRTSLPPPTGGLSRMMNDGFRDHFQLARAA